MVRSVHCGVQYMMYIMVCVRERERVVVMEVTDAEEDSVKTDALKLQYMPEGSLYNAWLPRRGKLAVSFITFLLAPVPFSLSWKTRQLQTDCSSVQMTNFSFTTFYQGRVL